MSRENFGPSAIGLDEACGMRPRARKSVMSIRLCAQFRGGGPNQT